MSPTTRDGFGGSRPAATQELARVGLLAACIAHDVNNHLTAAYGQLELARTHSSASAAGHRYFSGVRRELEWCADLVKQLLTGDRSATLTEARTADPHDVLEHALDRFSAHAERKGIRIIRGMTPGPPAVNVPQWALKHVCHNVIANACEAMQEGGVLRVSTRRRNGQFEMRFADTGPGIPAVALERLFDLSFTTKDPPAGHGLGLATCRAVLEHIGGSIAVENGTTGGAVVTVTVGVCDG